jgi:hypothetical protein
LIEKTKAQELHKQPIILNPAGGEKPYWTSKRIVGCALLTLAALSLVFGGAILYGVLGSKGNALTFFSRATIYTGGCLVALAGLSFIFGAYLMKEGVVQPYVSQDKNFLHKLVLN